MTARLSSLQLLACADQKPIKPNDSKAFKPFMARYWRARRLGATKNLNYLWCDEKKFGRVIGLKSLYSYRKQSIHCTY